MRVTSAKIFEDRRTLSAYLAFGYLPFADRVHPFAVLEDWAPAPPKRETPRGTEPVIAGAVEALKGMAGPSAPALPGTRHVVLLSGGFDSRAILGSLLEAAEPSSIIACTYGTPGSDEFDLAARVAKVAGVEHVPIDIRDTTWTTEELVESVRARAYPPSFAIGARLQNYRIYRRFGADCLFWDGFLGDSLTGSHLKSDPVAGDWTLALKAFAKSNLRVHGSLAPADFDPLAVLPTEPFCSADVMAFDDQLDLAVRQACYIGNRRPSDHATAAPFANQESWQFWLSVPRSLRRDQIVYKEALAKAFPDLFAIPAAGGRGALTAAWSRTRWTAARRRLSRAINRRFGGRSRFADPHHRIGEEMRVNASLRSVVAEAIADLESRGLIDWLSPSRIWADHLSETADNTEAIRILVSLEIALKAGS